MAIDAEVPPPPALARAPRQRQAREAGELLADRIIAMQRRGARRPERGARHPAAAAPKPPAQVIIEPPSPSPASLHPAPTSPRPASSPSPPGRSEDLPRETKLPRGQLLRRPPRDDEYDRRATAIAPPAPVATRGRGRGELYDPTSNAAPPPRPAQLLNVNVDDGATSDHSSGSMPRRPAGGMSNQRQLFDPGRHDPVRFAAGSQGQQGSSNGRNRRGMISFTPSASSQSSATDGTSSLIDSSSVKSSAYGTDASEPPPPRVTPLGETFRRAYQHILALEARCAKEAEAEQRGREDRADEFTRDETPYTVVATSEPTRDDAYWLKAINLHKELAEAYHSFLDEASDQRLPASMQTLPQKYNIPTKLWQHAIFPLLQRLRRAQPQLPVEGEGADIIGHLVEFIYWAYTFYTSLLEEPLFAAFRSAWLEQLGDLARFRMAVAASVARQQQLQPALLSKPSGRLPLPGRVSPMARIDDDEAADSNTRGSDSSMVLDGWDTEEQETWRAVARDWYARGLAETPGNGRLHHHLGLLSKADDFRALYHFTRSLTASHPFYSARESIRPTLEATEDRARRVRPDATSLDMFVHLQSMLFTRIGLDDFDDVLARLEERLASQFLLLQRAQQEGATFRVIGPVRWTMLAVINIAALLQYGADDALLKRAMTKREPAATANGEDAPQAIMLAPSSAAMANGGDLAPGRTSSDGGSDVGSNVGPLNDGMRILSLAADAEHAEHEPPLTYTLAQRLTFSLLGFTIAHVMPPMTSTGRSPNPYIVVILTFLNHVAQQPAALELVERNVPWLAVIDLFNKIPRSAFVGLSFADPPSKLTGSAPLPEDWCFRGMDWTGRHVFGRGYWKSSSSTRNDSQQQQSPRMPTAESEVDVLATEFDPAVAASVQGIAEADSTLANQRWRRIAIAAAWLAKSVPGLAYDPATGKFAVLGSLQVKVKKWKAEDEATKRKVAKEKLAKETPSAAAVAAANAEVEEEDEDEPEEDNEERAEDSEAVKQLKARRRELRTMIRDAKARAKAQHAARVPSRRAPAPVKSKAPKSALQALPGYTSLVFDTNILLNSLKLFASLLESRSWTIIVPLAAVTELDGLTKASTAELAGHARAALAYLEAHVKSHGMYLKIQTSRANYLTDLAIRNETIDFAGAGDGARNMDDVILRAAAWQSEHFVDRSYHLSHVSGTGGHAPVIDPARKERAAKVALVTFDRNLRVKARARGLDAAGDSDLARLVLETSALDKG